jgi:predicted PurR-regulated permease PerM
MADPIPTPTRPSSEGPSTPKQRVALGVCALGAAAALIWISLPVASGLFLGTFLAFSLLGTHARFSRYLRRPGLSAILLALSSGAASIGGVLLLLYVVILRSISVIRTLSHDIVQDSTLQDNLARLQRATERLPFGPYDLDGHARVLAETAAAKLTEAVPLIAGATFGAALTFFFTVMSTFFVLRRWPTILAAAERMLPLHPMHTRVVLAEFEQVGKEVFVGTVLTGLIQGVLAGIGYGLGGAPEVGLLATLTALCSLVPAVGTLIVWVPVGLGLILSGHVGAGVFELAWGALVTVVVVDYVIRPRLVAGGENIPTLVTFISLFGGVELFGVIGLIFGPVIAAVAMALLRTYEREASSADWRKA